MLADAARRRALAMVFFVSHRAPPDLRSDWQISNNIVTANQFCNPIERQVFLLTDARQKMSGLNITTRQ